MEFRVLKKFMFVIFLGLYAYSISLKGQISKIKFAYGEEGVKFMIAVSCDPNDFNMSFEDLQFILCKDPVFIKKFENEFKKLNSDPERSVIDARIMAIVYYENKSEIDTLCFGEFHGIDLNGTFMQDNKSLLDIVKKKVWPQKDTQDIYKHALDRLSLFPSLKESVFIVENAYKGYFLDYNNFNDELKFCSRICSDIAKNSPIIYHGSDSCSVATHAAIFKFMTDTIPIQLNDTLVAYHFPFQYNHDDYAGEKDWANMFVTTLMATHKGNCHSLPLLYKIIAEELGEKAWLALAPNHLYIKLHNQASGWYNTELTSGQFPTDTWIKSSGYIHLDAIKNGIYMDTLSRKETIALCMIDLALGYQRKYPDSYDPGFVIKCCDKALEYFPHYMNGLLLKAETMYRVYEARQEKEPKELEEIEKLYAHIHQLGYRKMPKEMYLRWLESIEKNSVQKIQLRDNN